MRYFQYEFYQSKQWEKNLPKPERAPTRKPEEEEFRPSPSTSTKSSSRSTPTSESQRRPWTSWTPSSTTPSTESPLKDPSSSDSTREELSHPEKSNLPSSSSSQESWPDTLFLKEPRPSPSTSNNDLHPFMFQLFSQLISFSIKVIKK